MNYLMSVTRDDCCTPHVGMGSKFTRIEHNFYFFF